MPAAPAQARQFTQALLRKWDLDEFTDQCTLVASELITNSLRTVAGSAVGCGHRSDRRVRRRVRPEVVMRVALTSAEVLVEVWDGSELEPRPVEASDTDERGRGLLLVSACSSRWDWYRAGGIGGKVVRAAWTVTPDNAAPSSSA